MASTNFTTHYSIPLPLGTDLTTPMDYNEAAEAVDTALFDAETDAGNASEAAAAAVTTANAAADAVDTVAGDLSQEKAKIVALQTRVTNAENEIDDVRVDSSDMITAFNEPTATASHRYEVGDFFIYNNTLYKATATIAIGATIVPDTNCETTNVSTELIDIKSALINKANSLSKGTHNLIFDSFGLVGPTGSTLDMSSPQEVADDVTNVSSFEITSITAFLYDGSTLTIDLTDASTSITVSANTKHLNVHLVLSSAVAAHKMAYVGVALTVVLA